MRARTSPTRSTARQEEARQRARLSAAVVLQTIGMPLAVTPRAPTGEQIAPGCTVRRLRGGGEVDGDGAVRCGLAFVVGLGFGVGLGLGFGLGSPTGFGAGILMFLSEDFIRRGSSFRQPACRSVAISASFSRRDTCSPYLVLIDTCRTA